MGFRTFLVPYDFSAHSHAALAAALELAKRLDAEVHVLHVVLTPSYPYAYGVHPAAAAHLPIDTVELREAALRSLDQMIAKLGPSSPQPKPRVVEGTAIADTIQAVAEQLGADLIVMGTHGRTGLAHVFLGSVAERTLRKAPCPVMTVQGEEEQKAR
jgi:nucleotide-binding universal stress UspA family protein